ncbi:MAG: DUF3108 domain-containing protein [Candidatus Cyclobacteriaceae bacterium M3_2C_046]
MKHLIVIIAGILMLSAFSGKEVYEPVTHHIAKGEQLEFKVNFGIFTVGRANMMVYPETYEIHNRPCYKVDVFGKTTGAVGWLAKVDDNWGAYVDTAALLPHITWRNIAEGKFRKNELVNFDHQADLVKAKVINNKTGRYKEPEIYDAPDNVRDLIGGFLYLRSLDFSRAKYQDTIQLHAFFEDTIYDFRIMYMGRERVKTKVGVINTVKLVPIMPDNKLFAGENSITLWLSDDKNKIPVKAEANMFIGRAGIEIINFDGLNHAVNFDKEKG